MIEMAALARPSRPGARQRGSFDNNNRQRLTQRRYDGVDDDFVWLQLEVDEQVVQLHYIINLEFSSEEETRTSDNKRKSLNNLCDRAKP